MSAIFFIAPVLDMSVWNHIAPCYKGEVLAILSKQLKYETAVRIPDIWQYTLSADQKLFPGVPSGHRAGLIAAGEDLSCDGTFQDHDDMQTRRLLKLADKWDIGIVGVYRAYFQIVNGQFGTPLDEDTPRDLSGLVDKIAAIMAAGSALPKVDSADMKRSFDPIMKVARETEAYEAMCIHLAKAHKIHSYVRHVNECKRGELKRLDKKLAPITSRTPLEVIAPCLMDPRWFSKKCNYTVARYRGVLYLVGEDKRGFLLTGKDWSRVILMLRTFRNARVVAAYLERYHGRPGASNGLSYMRAQLADALAKGKDLNSFCEAWEASRKYLLAKIAGPMSVDSAAKLKEDIAHLSDLVDPDKLESAAPRGSVQEFTEFLSVNKVLCAPDYDIPGGFSLEKKYHMGKNKVGAELSEEAEKIYQGFLVYNRFAFIKQYQRANKRNPGRVKPEFREEKWAKDYGKNKIVRVAKENADKIDLRGCLKYKARDSDYHMYFEDTAMTPGAAVLSAQKLPDHRTNQIVHLLKADEKIDLRAEKDKLIKEGEDTTHYISVGYKNEAAKADGRLYFIFTLVDKILLAEEEENISQFLKDVPGNAVGIDEHELKLKMTRMWEQIPQMCRVFLSDDISKWSPHMPKRVQRDSDAFWAEVFDQEHLAHMHKIQEHDLVCLNVLHWRASYKSDGANKEGTTGKRISYLMTNLKAYCVNIAKSLGVMQGSADLLTFLDDGLTAVDVPLTNPIDNSRGFMATMRDVQFACGYELKIYKSYPSDRFMIFLNIMYYKGAKLYDPVKAFIKRGIQKVGVVLSLPERIREVGAWASGAVKSGSELYFTYICYIETAVGVVWSWVKNKLADSWASAVQFVAPVSHQGFGLSNLAGICSNLCRTASVDSLCGIWVACRSLTVLRPYYMKLINLPVREKAGESFIRAPATVLCVGHHLQETRVARRLETFLLSSNAGVYMKPVISFYSDDGLTAIGEAVIRDASRISELTVDRLYKALPENYVARLLSKFKKCKSVAALIGDKALNKIQRANALEAIRVVTAWNTL